MPPFFRRQISITLYLPQQEEEKKNQNFNYPNAADYGHAGYTLGQNVNNDQQQTDSFPNSNNINQDFQKNIDNAKVLEEIERTAFDSFQNGLKSTNYATNNDISVEYEDCYYSQENNDPNNDQQEQKIRLDQNQSTVWQQQESANQNILYSSNKQPQYDDSNNLEDANFTQVDYFFAFEENSNIQDQQPERSLIGFKSTYYATNKNLREETEQENRSTQSQQLTNHQQENTNQKIPYSSNKQPQDDQQNDQKKSKRSIKKRNQLKIYCICKGKQSAEQSFYTHKSLRKKQGDLNHKMIFSQWEEK